jgi:hypothetical protein
VVNDAVRQQIPPRALPILYYGVAHAALALAFAAIAVDPAGVAAFFYQPRTLGIVHLVTLGWVTSSILGSLYLVGPMAFRVRFAATWLDYTAFGLVVVGISGMVAHFWLKESGGMAWSAATVGTGILLAGARMLPQLAGAGVPRAVTTHIVLAFANLGGAAALGVLIAFDQVHRFLPGAVLSNVYAHAHLAAIGWASMMVVGVAYRLLPMVLPAQMPVGPRLWITAVLLEAGVIGLVVGLLLHGRLTWLFALLVVAGFGAFLAQVVWMLRRPRPRPPALRTPDPAVLHAITAFASLVIAAVLGVWLAVDETFSPRLVMAYGVFGLVGFLAQIIVGMKVRLLPTFSWYWAFVNTEQKGPVPSPHVMGWRPGQLMVFVLWLVGVPVLAAGLAFGAVSLVGLAAWSLFAATLLDSVSVAIVLRHAFTKPAGSSSTAS